LRRKDIRDGVGTIRFNFWPVADTVGSFVVVSAAAAAAAAAAAVAAVSNFALWTATILDAGDSISGTMGMYGKRPERERERERWLAPSSSFGKNKTNATRLQDNNNNIK
jgi:hypothetical protein